MKTMPTKSSISIFKISTLFFMRKKTQKQNRSVSVSLSFSPQCCGVKSIGVSIEILFYEFHAFIIVVTALL